MITSRPNLVMDGKLDQRSVVPELRRAIDTLLRKGHFELSYDIRTAPPESGGAPASGAALENPELQVVFRGRDQDLLLEHNAELLKALEHVVLRWLRLDPQFYNRIRFDAGDYRSLRIEELKLSARVAADRVRESKLPFRFSSMAARERRILHLALQQEKGVRSVSEGIGDNRLVVVYPAE